MYLKVDNINDANLLNNKVKNNSWMIWFYADWCGHCQVMKEEWDKLTNKCKNTSLNMAKVNDQYISNLNFNPEINGYPTIKLYKDGKNDEDYGGERTSEAMFDFLLNHKLLNSVKSKSKSNSVHKKKKKSKSRSRLTSNKKKKSKSRSTSNKKKKSKSRSTSNKRQKRYKSNKYQQL